MTADEYTAWLDDESRNPYRIVLIEIDHSAGTIYLASSPYVSNLGQVYDDWINTMPSMETNLNDFGGVGDFDVKNEDTAIKWFDYYWYGHECRMLFGDMTWAPTAFKSVSVSAVDECKSLGDNEYRFILLDAGLKLDKQLVTVNTTRTDTVQEFIDWVAGEISLAITFLNVPSAKLALDLSVDMTSFSKAGDLLRDVARDINAEMRLDELGGVEIFVPSDDLILIRSDQIAAKKVRVVEVVRPYSRIEITMSDGTEVKGNTGISMGGQERVRKITTHLLTESDVDVLLAEIILECVLPCNVFEIPITQTADLIIVGDKLSIDHPDVKRNGVVSRVIREQLSKFSTLEVLVNTANEVIT